MLPRYELEPLPGFSPAVGLIAGLLEHVRAGTSELIRTLDVETLDRLFDPAANSIGALVAHIVALEVATQRAAFHQSNYSAEERVRWSSALQLGDHARSSVRGYCAAEYVKWLNEVRTVTLDGMRIRDDTWLTSHIYSDSGKAVTVLYLWVHLLEDEASHRGQMRWLLRRVRRPEVDRLRSR